MNRNALRGKIVEHGMTIGEFCNVAGFARATFDRKLNGKLEFNRDEMERIMTVLGLNAEEMRHIFFPENVA